MAISAISFEQERKCVDALAKELAAHDGKNLDVLEDWRKAEYKLKARRFFNAMYTVLRED